jgi:hypothetical protein
VSAKLDPVCQIRMLGASAFEIIGSTPSGFRMNSFITGGDVDGPLLRGTVRAQGCVDCAIVRSDDIADVDVRLTIETYDRALLFVTYSGFAFLGNGGAARIRRGEKPAPIVPLRIAARMSTSSVAYDWANRALFIGVGFTTFGEPTRIDYDIYRVSSELHTLP